MRCRTEVGRAAEAIVASGGKLSSNEAYEEGRRVSYAGLIPDDVMTRVVTSKLDTFRYKAGRNEPDGKPATHPECRIGSWMGSLGLYHKADYSKHTLGAQIARLR